VVFLGWFWGARSGTSVGRARGTSDSVTVTFEPSLRERGVILGYLLVADVLIARLGALGAVGWLRR